MLARYLLRYWGLSVFAWLCVASSAFAASCPAANTSTAASFLTAQGSGPGPLGESGVQAAAFLALPAGQPVVQGIDVSKFEDDTDFETAFACGARFAYIQLSAGVDQTDHAYRVHWPNARAAGLLAAPFHSLRAEPEIALTWMASAPAAKAVLFQRLVQGAAPAGQAQANLFLARLAEIISSEAGSGGVRLPPIALDMTFDPVPRATPGDKAQFGQVYAAAACAFLGAVRANPRTSGVQVILLAEPDVYAAYGLNQNGCGLQQLPVWIAYHARDGGSFNGPGAGADRGAIDNLCRPGGAADRCILQQYSTAGGFAVFNAGSHLHMDRFVGGEPKFQSLLQTYR